MTVNGSENGARSGAQTLLLLAAPLNGAILRALSGSPKQQAELQRATGFPAQTTLRAQLKRLVGAGVVRKRRRNRFPGVLEYELSTSGLELLAAARIVERWLERADGDQLTLGGSAAKAAIKALAGGWSTTMLRALAGRPLSLTELDRVIASLSYPSLERRLAAMRLAGLVKPEPSGGRGTPYVITRWGQEAIAPLAAAARWEQRHRADTAPRICSLDAEAAFLLAVPALRLPPGLSGSCRLSVQAGGADHQGLAGVVVDVTAGAVTGCTTQINTPADAWALGTPGAWFAATLDGTLDGLELGGDVRLATTLLRGFHRPDQIPMPPSRPVR
jgi:DNA-binding HxlR family transcriptional regulator